MALNLRQLSDLFRHIAQAYLALSSVTKQEGQAATETAKQILTNTLATFEELFAVIDSVCQLRGEVASPLGLKWFFVSMTMYGGVIVPALDALSLKLKTTVPSFKKKKGSLPAELDQV